MHEVAGDAEDVRRRGNMNTSQYARKLFLRAQSDGYFENDDWLAAREHLGSSWRERTTTVIRYVVDIMMTALSETFGASLAPDLLDLMNARGSSFIYEYEFAASASSWPDDFIGDHTETADMMDSMASYKILTLIGLPDDVFSFGDPSTFLQEKRHQFTRMVDTLSENFAKVARYAPPDEFLSFHEFVKRHTPRVAEHLMSLRNEMKGTPGGAGNQGELESRMFLTTIARVIEKNVDVMASNSRQIDGLISNALGASIIGKANVSAQVVLTAYAKKIRSMSLDDVDSSSLTSAHLSLLIRSMVDLIRRSFEAKASRDVAVLNDDLVQDVMENVPTVVKMLDVLQVYAEEARLFDSTSTEVNHRRSKRINVDATTWYGTIQCRIPCGPSSTTRAVES